jgi:hypothetical protein
VQSSKIERKLGRLLSPFDSAQLLLLTPLPTFGRLAPLASRLSYILRVLCAIERASSERLQLQIVVVLTISSWSTRLFLLFLSQMLFFRGRIRSPWVVPDAVSTSHFLFSRRPTHSHATVLVCGLTLVVMATKSGEDFLKPLQCGTKGRVGRNLPSRPPSPIHPC